MTLTIQRLLEGYLLQTREQIQQDLLTLIDSDDQELNDKMCQIVVDNFDKFFTSTKWHSPQHNSTSSLRTMFQRL